MAEKIVKKTRSYNLDAVVIEWLNRQAEENGRRSASWYLNDLLTEAMHNRAHDAD